MNKRMIFMIAGLAALVAADTAISIFSVRKHYKNKYEKISQDEISEMRAYYQERLRKAEEALTIAEKQSEDIELYLAKSANRMIKEARTNYANVIADSDYSTDPAESEHPEDDIPVLSEEEERDLAGERITKEDSEERGYDCKEIHISEFGESTTFATETLTYYIYDDILVDEQEMIIDRPEDLVGGVLLESGFTQDGRENIYVRNYRLRTDYEIVKAFASYQDYN